MVTTRCRNVGYMTKTGALLFDPWEFCEYFGDYERLQKLGDEFRFGTSPRTNPVGLAMVRLFERRYEIKKINISGFTSEELWKYCVPDAVEDLETGKVYIGIKRCREATGKKRSQEHWDERFFIYDEELRRNYLENEIKKVGGVEKARELNAKPKKQQKQKDIPKEQEPNYCLTWSDIRAILGAIYY